MKSLQFLFVSLFFYLTRKTFVNNFQKKKECFFLVEPSYKCYINKSLNNCKSNLRLSFLKGITKQLRNGSGNGNGNGNEIEIELGNGKRNTKRKRIYYERNGVNVPKDVSMFGKTNVFYIRENVYNNTQTNLKENEFSSFNDAELTGSNYEDGIVNSSTSSSNSNSNNTVYQDLKNEINEEYVEGVKTEMKKEETKEQNENQKGESKKDIRNCSEENENENENTIFNYLNKPNDFVVQVGNSPKVSIYERVYSADAQTLQRFFENINEVNIQLLKNIKSIDEKEKLINKTVIEKVREDIKKYQEMNEIMDVKGNLIKHTSHENKSKAELKKQTGTTSTHSPSPSINTSDLDEEEKNELLKKLYVIDKKTDKYIEENVYFVIQTWVPDLKIDDTLIVIDNIEKGYNDYDISSYYEKFKKAQRNNFYYDFESYKIENIPQHMNEDTDIECEHINSYNNTYNKLNNYNIKKYTYTYTTNENADTKFKRNEPMPPIVIINTKKNSMVQEWEGKNFKNRIKRNKSHEYTRIQRAFRPFSYVDLSDIICLYKYNFLQIKMKLSHRKYKNEIYPFFVPIDTKSSENLINFNGYKQNGDNAWSFFWHNFNYDKETDYSFLNRGIKLNVTENKFEEVNKKKSKKIMRNILKERKGK